VGGQQSGRGQLSAGFRQRAAVLASRIDPFSSDTALRVHAMIALAWACSVLLAIGMAFLRSTTKRLREQVAAERAQHEASRQRRAERELLLQTLLDASPAAIVFYADAGRIVYANQPAQQLFFEDQPAEGKNFLRLVTAGPPAFRAALLGSGDDIASFDLEGQRETYHFSRRTFDFAGEPHTLLIVRQLTREVARHEIEVLKRVVRLISHEVNNALGPVSSLVHSARQILKSGTQPERLERVFQTIDERAQHLAQFVAGYAALSKLPRAQPREAEWSPVLTRLAVLYPQARLSAKQGARGYFDAVQMEQALINLLKNANEAGGPLSDVALDVCELADGGALLSVSDRGAGFSPAALESGILPFFTSKAGGSGVGLTLVREVIDAHGGQLTLGNGPGGGALVSVRLPGRAPPLEPSARARLTLTRG
jgi:two-component system nitrogen regulation sensor histidine kinase NtrY